MIHLHNERASVTVVMADGGDLASKAQRHTIIHRVFCNSDGELVPGEEG